MACLYCGKEIGPFRLLRDAEFCSSAHRKGYRARLGKALGQISVEEPPPAPVASFIPYKPFPGNNRSTVQAWTIQRYEPELHFPHPWPLSIIPLTRESASPLSLPQAKQAASTNFRPENLAQPWPGADSTRLPRFNLAAENVLPPLEAQVEEDPAQADSLPVDLTLVDFGAHGPTALDAGAIGTTCTIRLLDISDGCTAWSRFAVCPASSAPAAEVVEAFLPMGIEPQIRAFPTAIAMLPWELPAVDWMIAADLAEAVRVPAAEAAEAFLPLGVEPRILAFQPAIALLPWELLAVDWVMVADLAGAARAAAAEAVEALLPVGVEPQMLAFPSAGAILSRLPESAAELSVSVDLPEGRISVYPTGTTTEFPAEQVQAAMAPAAVSLAALRPQLPMNAAEGVRAADLAEAATAPSAQPVENLLPPAAEAANLSYPAPAILLPSLSMNATEWIVAADLAEPATAPAAQAVENLLPPIAEPAILSYPAPAILLPSLSMNATEWIAAADLAEPATAPAAQAVENFLPPAVEPAILSYPASAVILPSLSTNAAEWIVVADLAEAATAPAAQAVENLLPLTAKPALLPYPASAIRFPSLSMNAAEWVLVADLAEAATAPAAQAVENLLPPTAEPALLPYPASAIRFPSLSMNAAEWIVAADMAEAATAPAAQAVENLLPPTAEPALLPYPASAIILPQWQLDAIERVAETALAPAANLSPAEVMEAFVPPAEDPYALPLPLPAPRMPGWSVVAADLESIPEPVSPVIVAPPSEQWMPSPPACEAVREVIPSLAGTLAAAPSLQTPELAALAIGQPMVRWEGDWRDSASAEPVCSYVAPHLEGPRPATFVLSLPNASDLHAGRRAACLAVPAAQSPHAAEPPQAAFPAAAQTTEDGVRWPQRVKYQRFALRKAGGQQAAEFILADASSAEPRTAQPNAQHAIPQPDPASLVQMPASPSTGLMCGLPHPGPVAMDFICQRIAMAPIRSLRWIAPSASIRPPKFAVRPVIERIEEVAAPPKPVNKPPAFAEIFAISKAARKRPTGNRLFSAGKAIAAGLLVGIGIWFGAGSVRIGRQMVAINTSLPGVNLPGTSSGADTGSRSASGFPSVRYASPQTPRGPIAAVRHAIQQRAAVELTDTFRRMEAWGAAAKALPAGWSRHSDGYVHTGELALYHPTQTFADYHFEFFGEIEKKSMGWAVRARDTQNYYAMKFTVVEPGLRPMIAAVHYPVVGGKKGRRVETPLSVMVHNNEPFHVTVDVKGDRVMTSIEGQEVDSWSDDALKVGGVGFFSDVGETARLYWIRVTKNQDWLGRVCAYLSNGSGNDTAELWRGDIPDAPSQPSQPAPPTGGDATLAAAETEDFSHLGPQRARTLKYGRTELCRS